MAWGTEPPSVGFRSPRQGEFSAYAVYPKANMLNCEYLVFRKCDELWRSSDCLSAMPGMLEVCGEGGG